MHPDSGPAWFNAMLVPESAGLRLPSQPRSAAAGQTTIPGRLGLSGTSLVPSSTGPLYCSAATKGLGGVNAVGASPASTRSSMAERAFRSHWTTLRADRVPARRAAGCRERPAQAGAIRAGRRNDQGSRAARRAQDWDRKALSGRGLSGKSICPRCQMGGSFNALRERLTM
jgi:hypothetical protein